MNAHLTGLKSDELAELLMKNPGIPVFQSCDAESNQHSPVTGLSVMYIEKDYKGGNPEITFEEEDLLDEFGREDPSVKQNFQKVFVVWSV